MWAGKKKKCTGETKGGDERRGADLVGVIEQREGRVGGLLRRLVDEVRTHAAVLLARRPVDEADPNKHHDVTQSSKSQDSDNDTLFSGN